MSPGVVLVVVFADEGRGTSWLARAASAPVAAGRRLAEGLGLELELLWTSSADADVSKSAVEGLGLDRLLVPASSVAGPADPPSPAVARRLARAVGCLARERGARILLMPHGYGSVEHLPAIALALDAAAVSGAVGLEVGEDGEIGWLRPTHQGKLVERLVSAGDARVVATVRAEGFGDLALLGTGRSSPAAPATVPVELDAAEDPGAEPEWLGDEEAGGGLDLAAARRLVAVGRGLGDPARLAPIERLCEALGAELAGSRPVIDAGWLPRERQVGSSGATVTPDLYVALGISGSAQHLAGMSSSKCIVAVNQDPEAPIFRVARYGIVGDLHEVVPALVAALNGPESG